MAIQIRPFAITDSEAVVGLWQSCGLVVPWNDPYKDIHRKIEVDPQHFLVGENNGSIIASVMGGYDGHRGWINYLGVCPTHRGLGYGRDLMDAIERLLQSAGCPKINLQIRDTNITAIAFYEAIGFGIDQVSCMGKRLVADE